MEQIWDPLRKKNVALTPEERVRQWFIGLLERECGVPMHKMSSEVYMKFGDKPLRADIVVWGRTHSPLVVVECKRPDFTLDSEVLEQALKYNMMLGAPYIAITNGHSTYIVRRQGEKSEWLTSLPQYSQICQQ
ncbi:MAG: type I restriction enzyme HsdR N-terminal domain-containing protein [Bacteroidales bacterium]|nr:type I restriction enzyme HsdR N-terminal domain-containing protein [Bacteroidales bacterium]